MSKKHPIFYLLFKATPRSHSMKVYFLHSWSNYCCVINIDVLSITLRSEICLLRSDCGTSCETSATGQWVLLSELGKYRRDSAMGHCVCVLLSAYAQMSKQTHTDWERVTTPGHESWQHRDRLAICSTHSETSSSNRHKQLIQQQT